MLLEACTGSLEQALLAEAGGAHRVELCSRLDLDGLSPSRDTIVRALAQLTIPVKIMVRSREGHFVFSEEEIRQMEREIDFCKQAGVAEVVLGASLPSGALDIPAIKRLAARAEPMCVTIHKAIDLSPDPLTDLEALRPIRNITHVLSSGKMPTALEGAPLLRDMIRTAGGRFAIIVAGKVTWENLQEVRQATGAQEYHGKRIVKNLTFKAK